LTEAVVSDIDKTV